MGVLHALRRRWAIALIVAVPLIVGAGRYAQSLPDEYEATAVAAFAPEGDATEAIAYSRDDRLVHATLVSAAATPSALFGPPRGLMMAAAVLVALVLAVGVAVLAADAVGFPPPRPSPIRAWARRSASSARTYGRATSPTSASPTTTLCPGSRCCRPRPTPSPRRRSPGAWGPALERAGRLRPGGDPGRLRPGGDRRSSTRRPARE